ncbi:MAG: hypothetical protein ACUVRX_07110 [Actinomycetota bacterium]
MRVALKAIFWMAAAVLAASAVSTVLGSTLNLETALRAGGWGWISGCLLLFAGAVLVAFSWTRSRGRGGRRGG